MKRFFKTYYMATGPLIGATIGYLLTDRKFYWWTWAINIGVFVLMIFICRWQQKQRDEIEAVLQRIRRSRTAKWN